MLRTESYVILQKIAVRAQRASGAATSMLTAGCRSLDAELRGLRAEASDDLLRLSFGVASSPFAVGEAVATVRLGSELCRVLDSAAQTALLLRGRTVRSWMPFDRVRTVAALTGALISVVALLGKCNERNMHTALSAFCEESLRLARLGEHWCEDVTGEADCAAVGALMGALDRWQDATHNAYGFAVGLL